MKNSLTEINENFKPTEKTYNNLRKHGAIPEFVDWEMEFFIAYFVNTQGKKRDWQMACQRWMRTAWQGKQGRAWERERHFRNESATQGNIFESTLDKITQAPAAPTNKKKIRYKPTRTALNVPRETMTTEDALKELAKIGKKLRA